MAPTITQDTPRAASLRWVGLGLATIGVLTLVDVAGALVEEPRKLANIAGTLALAPALTGVGGTRRQTAWVGVVAFVMAVLLAFADGVPFLAGVIRCVVVAVAGAVAAVVAGHRTAQVAQLQDRREAARTLQAAMLTDLPEHPGLEMAARYLPASSGDQVGGDWFDGLLDARGRTTLVIGDVTGHDIQAAAAMGQLRAMLRAFAVEGTDEPAALLTRLDAAIDRLGLDVLATVVVVQVLPASDRRGRRVRWSNAGHPEPVLLHTDGRVEVLGAGKPHDLLIGAGGTERTGHETTFEDGATLFLHTDGLVERRGEDLTVGAARLSAALAGGVGKPLTDLLDGVLLEVLGPDHLDDVALLAARAR